MYHLAKSLYLHYTSKEEYYILLVGLDGAGKTTLFNQIKALYNNKNNPSLAGIAIGQTPFQSQAQSKSQTQTSAQPPGATTSTTTVPTLGQSVTTIDLGDVYLKFCDVGGNGGGKNGGGWRLWTKYFSSAHAVVFVVDSADLGAEAGLVEAREEERGSGGGGRERKEGGDDNGQDMEASVEDRSMEKREMNTTTTITNTTLDKHKRASSPASPSTPSGRLSEHRSALSSLLRSDALAGIPILVLANKQDRDDSVESVRVKEAFVRRAFETERTGQAEKTDKAATGAGAGAGAGATGDVHSGSDDHDDAGGASDTFLVRDSRVLPVSALHGTGVREAVEWVKTRVVWNRDRGVRKPVMR